MNLEDGLSRFFSSGSVTDARNRPGFTLSASSRVNFPQFHSYWERHLMSFKVERGRIIVRMFQSQSVNIRRVRSLNGLSSRREKAAQ